jgi:4-hydroxybenzoate polyprenyltransferase
MKNLVAFFKLIRWPNLFFIALTQALFHFCILVPIFSNERTNTVFNTSLLGWTIAASVLIAAGGYIINDYFDINIDQINKPGRQIIGKHISRRGAILWHSVLSFVGVVISFYIGWKLRLWWIGVANTGCTFLLFVYSTTFKKRFLSGNIIISMLTAWSVAILGLATFFRVYGNEAYRGVAYDKILRFTILYAGFAFIISLIREAIKDMEDMQGDVKYGCRTLPIVGGINAAKTYVVVWMVVLIGVLLIVQFYALQFNWWIAVIYSFFFLIIPLLYAFQQMFRVKTSMDFHRLSSITKLVMMLGILSMVVFKIYL